MGFLPMAAASSIQGREVGRYIHVRGTQVFDNTKDILFTGRIQIKILFTLPFFVLSWISSFA